MRNPKSHRGAARLIVFALSCAGCAPTGSSRLDAGLLDAAARDARPSDGPVARDASNRADRVLPDLDFAGPAHSCEQLPPAEGVASCCAPERLRPAARAAASVLDLSTLRPADRGTCGGYEDGEGTVGLPADPAMYPVKVVLPAGQQDAACAAVCETGGSTQFGVAIEVPRDLIGGDSRRVLAIAVSPPWFFVSGGCGEPCPWPCLDGYQEFGVRSCITLAYGSFGFATAAANAPSVEARIELIEAPGGGSDFAPGGCCLFE